MMNISELENLVDGLRDSISDLENLAGANDEQDTEEYREELESAACYIGSLADDVVDFLNENSIKDERDDANTYFKIDSVDARLKADFLAPYFERLYLCDIHAIFKKIKL
jgi:hypothetical protein